MMRTVSSQVLEVGIEQAARVDIVNDETVCDLTHDDSVALAMSVVQQECTLHGWVCEATRI